MPSLDHLRSFLAVYRRGSITHAARQLGIAQPSVTAHVRALEAEAGRPLFTREARGVTPTALAHDLARSVSSSIDGLVASTDVLRGAGARAIVRIGGPADLLAHAALPSLAGQLGTTIALDVHTGIAEDLLGLLAADELDLVIATRRQADRRLRFEALFREQLCLVLAPAWRSEIRAVADADLFDRVPLVAFDADLPLVRELWRAVFDAAVAAPPALIVPDLRAVCAAVASGAGASVVPSYLAAGLLQSGALLECALPRVGPTSQLYLAARPSGTARRSVDDVRRQLLAAATAWERA